MHANEILLLIANENGNRSFKKLAANEIGTKSGGRISYERDGRWYQGTGDSFLDTPEKVRSRKLFYEQNILQLRLNF